MVFSQTHTSRGGGPNDVEIPKRCGNFVLGSAYELKMKYLKIFLSTKQIIGLEKREDGEKVFRELIYKQDLGHDLNLVSMFNLPSCKSCLSESKQILLELIDLDKRHEECRGFFITSNEIRWMKNIIIYGK